MSIVPTWMLYNLYMYAPYIPSKLVLPSDLSTVREFLLKQTQLKCLTFGQLTERTEDMFDTVKVLKCYSGLSA